jgi:hypothetical protein
MNEYAISPAALRHISSAAKMADPDELPACRTSAVGFIKIGLGLGW